MTDRAEELAREIIRRISRSLLEAPPILKFIGDDETTIQSTFEPQRKLVELAIRQARDEAIKEERERAVVVAKSFRADIEGEIRDQALEDVVAKLTRMLANLHPAEQTTRHFLQGLIEEVRALKWRP